MNRAATFGAAVKRNYCCVWVIAGIVGFLILGAVVTAIVGSYAVATIAFFFPRDTSANPYLVPNGMVGQSGYGFPNQGLIGEESGSMLDQLIQAAIVRINAVIITGFSSIDTPRKLDGIAQTSLLVSNGNAEFLNSVYIGKTLVVGGIDCQQITDLELKVSLLQSKVDQLQSMIDQLFSDLPQRNLE